MVLYHLNTRSPWHETGFGIDYNSTLEISYEQPGNYTFCFLKQNPQPTRVTFEIINEDDTSEAVGKEQLARLSRQMTEIMVDVRQAGTKFGRIVSQHNERKDFLATQMKYFKVLLGVKIFVMLLVIGIQIVVIKKIFK
jgi:hypothetical protein